jgi:hypothetical protein
MVRLPRAIPIKLPQAPKEYDKGDQDRTRRLIETLLSSAGLSVSSLGQRVAGRQRLPQTWTPISPIHGTVLGISGANPILVQVLNPVSANKFVVIYVARVIKHNTNSASSAQITSSPRVIPGASNAGLAHLDERDSSTITTTLASQVANPSGAPGAAMFVENGIVPNGPYNEGLQDIRDSHDLAEQQPIVLLPGQALEFGTPGNNSDNGNGKGLYVVLDELAASAVLPHSTLDESNRPISSIMGGIASLIGSAARATVQLLNPPTSNATLRVTEILFFTSGTSTRARARITTEPLHMGLTAQLGAPHRLNSSDTDPILGIVQASQAPSEGSDNLWDETQSFWYDKCSASAAVGPFTHILKPGAGPMFVRPGSAIEFQTGINSDLIYAVFIWDEI